MDVLGQCLSIRNMETINYPSALSIAGSDSGGCAGIQADIKSMSACGAYAATVITATTAQNTQGVTDIHAIPVQHIAAQLKAVLTDIDFGAIKIGMLHSPEVIETVEATLANYPDIPIVLDPVMVATSGDKLINEAAIERLKQFLPKATLVTPNIPEAAILLGKQLSSEKIAQAAMELGKQYKTSVLLKGGHTEEIHSEMTDVLYVYEEDRSVEIRHPKYETKNTHGTGCSLSSSVAAFLAQGMSLDSAVWNACGYVNESIAAGVNRKLGKGNGPINHFGL